MVNPQLEYKVKKFFMTGSANHMSATELKQAPPWEIAQLYFGLVIFLVVFASQVTAFVLAAFAPYIFVNLGYPIVTGLLYLLGIGSVVLLFSNQISVLAFTRYWMIQIMIIGIFLLATGRSDILNGYLNEAAFAGFLIVVCLPFLVLPIVMGLLFLGSTWLSRFWRGSDQNYIRLVAVITFVTVAAELLITFQLAFYMAEWVQDMGTTVAGLIGTLPLLAISGLAQIVPSIGRLKNYPYLAKMLSGGKSYE